MFNLGILKLIVPTIVYREIVKQVGQQVYADRQTINHVVQNVDPLFIVLFHKICFILALLCATSV